MANKKDLTKLFLGLDNFIENSLSDLLFGCCENLARQ
jgi:hypothetical protein